MKKETRATPKLTRMLHVRVSEETFKIIEMTAEKNEAQPSTMARFFILRGIDHLCRKGKK